MKLLQSHKDIKLHENYGELLIKKILDIVSSFIKGQRLKVNFFVPH